MRLKILSCEVLYREICLLAAESPHTCDSEFLPKGLHDLGVEKMRPRLQERIDAVPAGTFEAIVLVYGLCNNGIDGLMACHTRLVVPRAHDCITLFMGSRKRYLDRFYAHPGTYFRTTGWIERCDSTGANDVTVSQKLGLFVQYEELVKKYGEDNAKYIMETMGNAVANYDTLAFISMGLACERRFREMAVQEAKDRGWRFEDITGSMDLLRKLVNAEWDADFLVLEPGETIKASHDDNVIRAVPVGK